MYLRFNHRKTPFLLLVCLLFAGKVFADNGTGVVAAEATVYENDIGENGGGDSHVCVGNLAGTAATRRGFIRWNLPAIPAGSTITRVELAMTQDDVRTMGGGAQTATLQIRRVTADWTEGTGSGSGGGPCGGGSNVSGVDWSNAPAVDAALSGTEALPTSENFAFTFDTDSGADEDVLISDVQSWVDGGENFGWRLELAEEGTANNARRIIPGSITVHWTPPDLDLVFANGFE